MFPAPLVVRAAPFALLSIWREWRSRQPLLFNTAVAHAALFALCVILAMFDDTRITGVNRWIKPMKFAVSIAIYLASMAWY